MKRRLFVGGLAATALCAAGGRSRLAQPADELEKRVPEWLKEHYVPGAAAAVLRKGKPAWVRAWGLARANPAVPVRDSTVFQAASLSKPVFAYAVLSLAAAGKFDLDRTLTSYLENPYRSRFPRLMASEVPADARLQRVTPRIVLRHSTGFPNWGRNRPLTFEFEPGEKFGYSGEGYTYLQNVIEHITGGTLQAFLQEHALTPLGMESSSFVWRPDYDARAAIGYNRQGAQEKWRPQEAFAAGTLHTTAGDYGKFLEAMLRPRASAGLDESWLRRMLAPATRVNDSLAWGLGWGLEPAAGGTIFWQWGDDGEFKAFALGSRELETAAVILTNGANGLRVCRGVIEAVFPGPRPLLSFERIQY